MATGDDEKPEEPDPLLNADGTRKPDLRYTEHQRGNVRVERSLDQSGHLARGDKTHMSVLNFSARAQSRTERDHEFDFRHRGEPGRPEPASAPPPAAAAPAPPPAEAPPAAAAAEPGSLLGKIKRILGL